MKITIVCGFFLPMPPEAGGAMEKMWWRLARLYTQRGHTVTLISRRWQDWPHDEMRDGVHLIRLSGASHRPHLWKNLLLDALWGLRVLFALPPADILITNTITLPIFAPYLRPKAGKLVVNLNRYPKGQLRHYRRADRIQVPTAAIATAARSQAPALATRIQIFPNSIDCALFSNAKHASKHPPSDVPLKIGFFGRIHPEKGIHTLVRAAALLAEKNTQTGTAPPLPPWQLILRGPIETPLGGGGPDYEQQLRALAPTLWQSGQITLAPPIFDEKALAEAYTELTIFCYPSEAAQGEAHPVAVIEAMASGLAVVTSDLPVFLNCLQPEEDSLNFPMGDAQKLANALERLLREDVLRERLRDAAQKSASKFDDAQIATAHLADYEALIS